MQEWKRRTTLAIVDDVLKAARVLANQQHRSGGEVISGLASQTLRRPAPADKRNGVPLLSSRSDTMITFDLVNALRDKTA